MTPEHRAAISRGLKAAFKNPTAKRLKAQKEWRKKAVEAVSSPERKAAFIARTRSRIASMNREQRREMAARLSTNSAMEKRRKWYSGLSAKLTGIERTQPLVAKGVKHWAAKTWEIRSGENVVYGFKNLSEFVRTHQHLFHDDDVIWKGSKCRATAGIGSLFRTKGRIRGSWKGWTVAATNRVSQSGHDLLCRTRL